ncbi:MAG TPA: ABC transporter ATP-binding protein [Atribacteraceae bacterium]|nr:ABC transporter ATP-binding protein [Atribacteraceae bacterium]
MFVLENVWFKNILRVEHLRIPAGEITAIVGESGSGKTTLLRHLNLLTSPDRGTVRYRGEDLCTLDPVTLRRQVVMLPQAPPVFPGTVRENLLIGRRFSGQPPLADESLKQALEQFRLYKALDGPTEHLSGGEKQRLALARVVLMSPEVLLLDEPSANLDEETADLVVGTLVHQVRESGRTLVMVTHSRSIAERYADNLVEMNNGNLLRSLEHRV